MTAHAMLPAALLPFEPAILGGLTLGTLVISKLILTGRVLGISGAVSGLVFGSFNDVWRISFVAGMLSGGAAFSYYNFIPGGGFEMLPADTAVRFTIAGLLVGLGTVFGNGCTSGHGLCGISRLSLRSIASTMTFMVAGIVTALLTNSSSIFQLPSGTFFPPVPSPEVLLAGKVTLALSVGITAVLGLTAYAMHAAHQSSDSNEKIIGDIPDSIRAVEQLTEFSIGFLFAAGLYISGMTKPSNLIAFLTLKNPTMIFVMGSALLVATPLTQLILKYRYSIIRRPACTVAFALPSQHQIDNRLLGGSVLFGAGWGLVGVCPGPGIVLMSGTWQSQIVLFIAAMVVGMMMTRLIQ